jgi:hypothetical protein
MISHQDTKTQSYTKKKVQIETIMDIENDLPQRH